MQENFQPIEVLYEQIKTIVIIDVAGKAGALEAQIGALAKEGLCLDKRGEDITCWIVGGDALLGKYEELFQLAIRHFTEGIEDGVFWNLNRFGDLRGVCC